MKTLPARSKYIHTDQRRGLDQLLQLFILYSLRTPREFGNLGFVHSEQTCFLCRQASILARSVKLAHTGISTENAVHSSKQHQKPSITVMRDVPRRHPGKTSGGL